MRLDSILHSCNRLHILRGAQSKTIPAKKFAHKVWRSFSEISAQGAMNILKLGEWKDVDASPLTMSSLFVKLINSYMRSTLSYWWNNSVHFEAIFHFRSHCCIRFGLAWSIWSLAPIKGFVGIYASYVKILLRVFQKLFRLSRPEKDC